MFIEVVDIVGPFPFAVFFALKQSPSQYIWGTAAERQLVSFLTM